MRISVSIADPTNITTLSLNWYDTGNRQKVFSGMLEMPTTDGVGEPKKAPCVSCHDLGKECILVESRRGGDFRSHRRTKPSLGTPGAATRQSKRSSRVQQLASNGSRITTSKTPVDIADQEYDDPTSSDSIEIELRNPSDALQILVRSGEVPSIAPTSYRPSPDRSHLVNTDYALNVSNSASPGHMDNTAPMDAAQVLTHRKPSTTVLDDYELVQRGLIHPGVLPELLHIYSQNYHPYFPIVPSFLIGPLAMEKIQRSEYFLLTVILTIASRDSPNHALTHRYCWDHTQRLLLEVVLAHPWAQTPRTVEGLLLLSEWLPHTQMGLTTGTPKNLFNEDRTAWSLVGLAIRQGYLLHLDRGAFRNSGSKESDTRQEQNRLIWAFVYLADRQISVRLGQSFWSRGPALSTRFTAQDFPTLQPIPGVKDQDDASVLQANLELIQILYNAHGVLYSSSERTLMMIYDGDYSRYLDDFLRAATAWNTTWSNLKLPHNIKTTLLLTYEYICLYVNAFSFQAVLTRASQRQPPRFSGRRIESSPSGDPFPCGIMSSPDGKYVFDAITAAMNLLSLLNGLDPQGVLCYLPSRYFLYGIYAAVFLYKAQHANVFSNTVQSREVKGLALSFVSAMEKASSEGSHVCRGYSRMLKKLWNRGNHRKSSSATHTTRDNAEQQFPLTEPGSVDSVPISSQPQLSFFRSNGQPSPDNSGHGFDNMPFLDMYGESSGIHSDGSTIPTIEGYLFGSFLPGVTDFGNGMGFDGDISTQTDPMLWNFADNGFIGI